jgi:hypothetical protein
VKTIFDFGISVSVGCAVCTPGGYLRVPYKAEEEFPDFSGNLQPTRWVKTRKRMVSKKKNERTKNQAIGQMELHKNVLIFFFFFKKG